MKPLNVIVLLVIGVVATAAGGWYSAELPEGFFGDELTVRRTTQPAKQPENRSVEMRDAASALRTLGLGITSAIEIPPSDTAASEPPPEVDQLLAAALKAIIRDGDTYSVLIVDNNSGQHLRRSAGQTYLDGWRFDSVSPAEITIKKGRETKTIPVPLRIDSIPKSPPASPEP